MNMLNSWKPKTLLIIIICAVAFWIVSSIVGGCEFIEVEE